jgi:hypothetical protein
LAVSNLYGDRVHIPHWKTSNAVTAQSEGAPFHVIVHLLQQASSGKNGSKEEA